MSSIYNLEPPTKGKVVLHTSLGDIDIELWPKEAPRAVRNFVQLCLEGYYDSTIFHRLIKDFMLQGGDPTGTGDGGASIYGHPFKDEFHTRLKFNHRGLVACANRNQPDTNGSQFFITLDRADHCDRKYTIFGKVTGDTIYNLLRFNDLETGDDDRPVEPPRLMRADVLWNPFDDIKPRVDREAKEAAEADAAKKREVEERKARKASKNFKLISFGEEAEEEEQQGTAAAAKIRSAHDVLEDERLSKEAALEVDLAKVREAVRAAKAKKVQERDEAGPSGAAGADEEEGGAPRDGGGGGGDDFGARMRARMEVRRKEMGDDKGPSSRDAKGSGGSGAAAGQEEGGKRGRGREPDSEDESEDSQDRKRSRLAQRPQVQKASAAVVLPSRQIKVADAELLTDWERKRQEYKQRKRLGGERQKATLEKMARFASTLKGKASAAAAAAPAEAAPAAAVPGPAAAEQPGPSSAAASKGGGEEGYRGEVRQDVDHKAYMPAAWRADNYLDGEDEGDDLTSLRQHKLSFAKDARDAMSRSDNVDDYVVVDPLLEKGKAKFNKLMQRQKKRENEWAGGSIT